MKMINKNIILIILIFNIGCGSSPDYKLCIANKSDKEICVIYMDKSEFENEFLFENQLNLNDPSGTFLYSQSTICLPAIDSWESTIDRREGKKLHFYIFDAIAFRDFKKGRITKNRLQYQYMTFTKEQLQKMNWEIIYKDTMPKIQVKTKMEDSKSTTPPPWVNKKK